MLAAAALEPGAHSEQFHEPKTPLIDPAGQATLAVAPCPGT